jgi:hypothetical protein
MIMVAEVVVDVLVNFDGDVDLDVGVGGQH